MRTITDILEEWRTASRALADLDPTDPARHGLRARVDALRGEYLARFDFRRDRAPMAPADGEELPAVSDEMLASVAELQSLLVARDGSTGETYARLTDEIEAASAEILRLATLQRRLGDLAPSQPRTADSIDGAAPTAAVTDTPAPRGMTRESRALLLAAQELRALEREKRTAEISSPRFHELAARVEERARRVFRLAEGEQEDRDRTG